MQSHRNARHAPTGQPLAGIGLLAAFVVFVAGFPDAQPERPQVEVDRSDLEAAFGAEPRPRDDVFLGFSPAPPSQLRAEPDDAPLALARLERALELHGEAAVNIVVAAGAPADARHPATTARSPGSGSADRVAPGHRVSGEWLPPLPVAAPRLASAAGATTLAPAPSGSHGQRPPISAPGPLSVAARSVPRSIADPGFGPAGDGATPRGASHDSWPRPRDFASAPRREGAPVAAPLTVADVPGPEIMLGGTPQPPAAPPFRLTDGVEPGGASDDRRTPGPPSHAGPPGDPIVLLGASVAPASVGEVASERRGAAPGGAPVHLTPEPATALLLGGGLVALALRRRR